MIHKPDSGSQTPECDPQAPVNYDHHEAMRVLAGCACRSCGGSGERNDAEPGDISFRSWICTDCGGKGWNRQAYHEAFPSSPIDPSAQIEAQAAQIARLTAENERLRAALPGQGCDANGGGDHSVISQGTYSFCANCGETVRVKNCRARAALAQRKGTDQ